MTKNNSRLLDIYTDYLLSFFGTTTATGLAALLPEVSHDSITRFLSQETLTSRDLWKVVKPQVRSIERDDAVLAIDDTIQEKRYTDESELICWHYDHCVGRMVKGINMVSALYVSAGVSIPVAFELVQKTLLETNPKTGKDKWVCPTTKNEMARDMIAQSLQRGIRFKYVLGDQWFGSAENMVFIKGRHKKEFIFPLKHNRRVALSLSDQKCGRYRSLGSLEIRSGTVTTLYLEGVPFPVLVGRQLFTNEDGSQVLMTLCSSDLTLECPALFEIYHKRWKIEEYHKSLKSNAGFAKSPTKLPHTQTNHIFASLVAFTKLEAYRTQTHLNHFALKAKLYLCALASAWEQMGRIKQQHPIALTIT